MLLSDGPKDRLGSVVLPDWFTNTLMVSCDVLPPAPRTLTVMVCAPLLNLVESNVAFHICVLPMRARV